MTDLTTWLRAQLDEDERVAREASGDTWVVGTSRGYRYSHPGDVYAIAHEGTPARIAQGTACGPDISAEQSSAHIARLNPARVLAEVEAKRRILDWAEALQDRANENNWWSIETFDAVALLALPYASEPGYRDEWRP